MLAIPKHMAMVLHVKHEHQYFGLDLLTWAAPRAPFVMTFGGLPFKDAISLISCYSYAYGYVFATKIRNPWPAEKDAMNSDSCLLTSLTDLWPGALDPWPLTHEQSTLSPEPWALAMLQKLNVMNHNNSTWNIYFFNEKHTKLNKKHMFSIENHCFFCFSSFAAVFY